MNSDKDKWRNFQDRALKLLTFESDVKTILLIRVINSFSSSIVWRITESSKGEDEKNYFAEFRRWRSEVDQEKFRSSVELLKHLNSLKPTIEEEVIELESQFVENTMAHFSSVNIPPFIQEESFGLDGVMFEVEFIGSFLSSKFSWWNYPPKEWKELGDIVEKILKHLNSKFSVREV